ncbi:MAG: Flp pilus assembly complex ATPase component TadA [Deltaproteobacteria bacterium]|nr:Flp pilus assembly complex ATPase component TadA [Deltaproteobacteria bacterium]
MTPPKQALTIEFAAQILLKRGLISKDQYKDIVVKGDTQRARLQRRQDVPHFSKIPYHPDMVSPAEVILSFNLETPNSNGKILTEEAITMAIAEAIGIPYKRLDPLKLNMDVVTSLIPRPFAQKYTIVAIEKDGDAMTLAVADPYNIDEAIENLSRTKRIKIKLVLSSKSDIQKIVREFYGFRTAVMAAQKDLAQAVDISNLEQYVKLKGHTEIDAGDQHVVNAVEYLLRYAFDQRASDIHIEPKRDKSFVRLRIDGALHYIHTIPKVIHPPIISRIKMMSRMDIAEKRKPQDGRIKTDYKDKEIELRVSTMPVAFGEKVVVRIFDPEILLQDIDQLGFYPRENQLFNSFIKRPNGIILVTGPTGSGKTTTLYSSLKVLSSPEVNILTIEDPIEMVMEEFNQVGVQPAVGVTFAGTLRTFLRQDPDIIMVGEVRDKETAEAAIQAALTGHLVLSTLHTNDAPSSIIRLMDLGTPAFLISSTIIGIVAQRLVRKICQQCKKNRSLTDSEIEYLELPQKTKGYPVHYGEGCLECRGTGYKGRTGIFEILDFTDRMRAVLSSPKIELADIQEVAKADGMLTLRQCAVKKMLEGITTYEEVVSVT